MMDGRYNTRSPAVKRLMREAQELSEPTDQYFAQPLDDNLFEWHFTVRGPADSDFQNGIYHGRIILPVDYPMKPPSIIWLTPNGRFETNKKICLSISGHHPESWQPSWSIRTALLAIIGFMPTHPGGAIGSLDYTPDERKVLSKKSKDWKCSTCGEITGILLAVSANTQAMSNEAKELAAQINLQGEKPKCKDGECPVEQARLEEMKAKTANATPESTPSQPVNEAVVQDENPPTTDPNTSVGVQQGLPATSPMTTPAPHQPCIPQFPQWSPNTGPFPMPPIGAFPPFPYPAMPPMPIPSLQFPYPPSHYSAVTPPQYNSSGTPSMGMYTTPFHPHTTPTAPSFSVNNSSNQENNETDFSSNMNDQYSRTPMTCPVTTTQSHTSTSSRGANAKISNDIQGQGKESDSSRGKRVDVFKELLSKVNRVDSGAEIRDKPTTTTATSIPSETEDQAGGSEISKKPNRSESVGDRLTAEGTSNKLHEEGSDSEMSKSLKRIREISVSEMGDTNTEDNSESDIPPIVADTSTGLEKCACSSTSDLERWKQKYQATKSLRQRQSATANVTTDVAEEGNAAESERSEVNATRQRIEAVSGDTGSRNRSRLAARLANHQNLAYRPDNVREERQQSFDFGFYLMVGMFTASLILIFNRLATIDWSDS